MQDMRRYIQTAEELWTFSDDNADEIRRNLESGHVAVLKLLLITSCPHLHTLGFAKRGLDPHTSLPWIAKAMKQSRRTMDWPEGFEALRNVQVGIDTVQLSWDDEIVHRDGRDFAALLCIPNLDSLYFNDSSYRGIPPQAPFKAGLKEPVLQKSVATGRKTSVHVCTLMNRDDGADWRNFPAKLDSFDLKTGSCGERPTSWRLNLQYGEWGPDCEGCGECQDCLVVYPADVWKSGRS
ncbi:hypothetical protein FBEOM_4712 [Fusarium beomiforme]|uniref:Uncharacterized protein n=1 Tax=Fusarium beomiforme TaxID=44412 RepID=A0A9P5AMP9_9HYPO|nr:hypothetical protein FBEOM_4712 [Fusarium beomiforme]